MTFLSLSSIGSLLGGVGLFMLGMFLMTEGLKLAAGTTLKTVLKRSTRTPLAGILSGMLITSLVQSSSAVTVATIGFVNAGLMNLSQALYLIYGSNIGTTMTGWLVAFIGFSFDIKVFALPAVGIGMFLKIVKASQRSAALGEALAGFGVFFLGIDVLRQGMAGMDERIAGALLENGGATSRFLMVLVGFLLTMAMQSSSAAMAIVLTALDGGLVTLEGGAALVIGANIGTTSTAALSVIGATPNAKRVAGGHVLFNLLTGLVALAVLPLLLKGVFLLERLLGIGSGQVKALALFHTFFNILGVVLVLPLTRFMVRFLKQRFRTSEEDESRPRFLDKTLAATPVLAVQALAKELDRMGTIARRMAKEAISSERADPSRLAADLRALDTLRQKIGEFAKLVRRNPLPGELDEALPNAMRVSGYYTEVAEKAHEIAKLQATFPPVGDDETALALAEFKQQAIRLLELADPELADFSPEILLERKKTFEHDYLGLKARLLKAGTLDQLPVSQMVGQLEAISAIRRLVDQAEKGARYLANLEAVVEPNGNLGEENHPGG